MNVKQVLLTPYQRSIPLIDFLLRIALIPFLLRTFYRTVESGLGWMRGYDGYIIGDWLINYQDGFVRRGFLGEVLFDFRALTGINLNILAMGLQLTLYALLFFFSALILLRTKLISPYFLLLFSPFLFRFQLQGFRGGFRKEILALTLIAFVCYASLNLSSKLFEYLFVVSLLIYPFIILSHEILILLLPYLIILYSTRLPLDKPKLILFGSISLGSVLAFALCLSYKGDPEMVLNICNSIAPEMIPDCATTSIGYLGESVQGKRETISHFLNDGVFKTRYLLSVTLAAVAYLPLLRYLRLAIQKQLQFVVFVLSIFGTTILGLVAFDWDRFFYIHLVSLFFISLAVQNQRESSQSISSLFRERFQQLRRNPPHLWQYGVILLLAIATFVYAKAWYITSCCVPQYGYLPLSPFGIDLVHLVLPKP